MRLPQSKLDFGPYVFNEFDILEFLPHFEDFGRFSVISGKWPKLGFWISHRFRIGLVLSWRLAYGPLRVGKPCMLNFSALKFFCVILWPVRNARFGFEGPGPRISTVSCPYARGFPRGFQKQKGLSKCTLSSRDFELPLQFLSPSS